MLDRVTHQRASSERVEYQNASWTDHQGEHYWGAKLNKYTTLARPCDPDQLERFAYTEERARFFYEALMSMYHIGRNMHNFFSDRRNILNAIERGAMPPLTDQQQRMESFAEAVPDTEAGTG